MKRFLLSHKLMLLLIIILIKMTMKHQTNTKEITQKSIEKRICSQLIGDIDKY